MFTPFLFSIVEHSRLLFEWPRIVRKSAHQPVCSQALQWQSELPVHGRPANMIPREHLFAWLLCILLADLITFTARSDSQLPGAVDPTEIGFVAAFIRG